jgi:molybdopterin molybdotransferase
MNPTQRLPASLTPLEAARDRLLEGLALVAPIDLPLAEALRSIAAEMPPLAASPARDIAAADGYAFSSRDLVGASSYSPLQLASTPRWVEAGDVMPEGCDCVIDLDALELSGPIAQIMAEAVPGQGVRRAGSDIAAGSSAVMAGRRVLPRDLLLARAAGLKTLRVRRPRLRIVNIPGGSLTVELIAESARNAGADVVMGAATGRDAASMQPCWRWQAAAR